MLPRLTFIFSFNQEFIFDGDTCASLITNNQDSSSSADRLPIHSENIFFRWEFEISFAKCKNSLRDLQNSRYVCVQNWRNANNCTMDNEMKWSIANFQNYQLNSLTQSLVVTYEIERRNCTKISELKLKLNVDLLISNTLIQ